MDYKQKVDFANQVASDLKNNKTVEEIKNSLKEKGLYELDISNIMASARNVLAHEFSPKIKEHLLNDKKIYGDETFGLLDDDIISNLIQKTKTELALKERKKITQKVKDNFPPKGILEQVDTRFLPLEEALVHIQNSMQIKKENSSGNRMFSFFGGAGLILLTFVIFSASGRLYYVLPIIGLGLIVKGLIPPTLND